MPDKANAQILQVLRRQAWQDLLVDRIVAECSLILCEAEAPQPIVKCSEIQSSGLLSAAVFEKEFQLSHPPWISRRNLNRLAIAMWDADHSTAAVAAPLHDTGPI